MSESLERVTSVRRVRSRLPSSDAHAGMERMKGTARACSGTPPPLRRNPTARTVPSTAVEAAHGISASRLTTFFARSGRGAATRRAEPPQRNLPTLTRKGGDACARTRYTVSRTQVRPPAGVWSRDSRGRSPSTPTIGTNLRGSLPGPRGRRVPLRARRHGQPVGRRGRGPDHVHERVPGARAR